MSTKPNKEESKYSALIAECAEARPEELKALEGLDSFWEFVLNPCAKNQGTLIIDISLRLHKQKPNLTPRQIAKQFYEGGTFKGMGFGGQYAKKLSNWYPVRSKEGEAGTSGIDEDVLAALSLDENL